MDNNKQKGIIMSYEKWLENIKVGDPVIELTDGDPRAIRTVKRLTKTKVVLSNDSQYRRIGNYGVGKNLDGPDWGTYTLYIKEGTPDAIKSARAAFLKSKTIKKIKESTLSDLDIRQLMDIAAIIIKQEIKLKKQEETK